MKTINTSRWEPWHLYATLALAGVGVALTWPTWNDIWAIANNDPEQSHVFLVPFVAAWMFWARRARLRNCPPGGTFVGPIIVALGLAASVLGYQWNIGAAWHLGAVGIVTGCILTILGKNVLFRFFPAFAALAFLVPVPGVVRANLSLPLQKATASITQSLLEALGFVVERSENLLRINGEDVAVAEACNGMRMVMALLLVSYAFAFSLPFRNSTRFIILLLSPVAALACNVLRLVPTVLVYGYSTKEAGDRFHDASGWVMLPVAFFLLMGVHRVLRWALLPVMRYNLAYE
jgi:exosortase